MRLLYLMNSLNDIGGISTITNKKIEWLILKYEFEIYVIVKKHHLCFEERFQGKLKIVRWDRTYHGLSIFQKFGYSISFFKYIKKTLIEFKPDVCISLLSSIDFFILPLVKKNIPKILEIHASATIIIQKSFPIKKIFFKLYNRVVVLNDLEKSKYGFNNLVVIPNFVSLNNLSFNDLNKKKIIISGGRNDLIKQYSHQIKAWNMIYSEFPDWEFHIYINGNYFELQSYNSLIDKNCTSIKIFSAVSNFSKILLESSIFVLTSQSESFSIMILEAFNSYNAVVSYKTFSGPLTLIDEKVGILVDMQDIDQLAKSISEVIKNDKLRQQLINNAKDKVLSYSIEPIMELWVNLFFKVHHENN